MRHTPASDTRPQDEPGFNLLHYLCQAYVDYLTAGSEDDKQQILLDVAGYYALCFRQGEEGEPILDLLLSAVQKRGRIYQDPDHWIEARGQAILTMISRRWLNREQAIRQLTMRKNVDRLSSTEYSALLDKLYDAPLSDFEIDERDGPAH